ncbi:T9SS type B sorting domain-containing protein [Abyssalbus ytuae]|uniref:T9SS type B sorting domain-containing protein n=1 Tax=Abyssalbus ytuae TaxID=2926907 RepID=A0A9E6ZY92_9FLAO|nr:T9SS type B sorting domain-containing protein [Abyssalbus ytuae]UOB19156.1 T9SS type B sorting domain-containing protein [Abyssalbus ytuae]
MKTYLLCIFLVLPFFFVKAQCSGDVGSRILTVTNDHPSFPSGVCFNDVINFAAVVEGSTSTTLVFQWQESGDGGNSWTDIPAEVNNTFSLTVTNNNYLYRFQVSEAADAGNAACTFFSPSVTVTYFDVSSNPVDAVSQCDLNGDGQETFDLTAAVPQIINGDSPANYNITFHASLAAAQAGSAPFANPGAFVNTSIPTQQIFVRVENIATGCVATHVFSIEVYTVPPVNTPVTLSQCDDNSDGISVFDLNDANPLVINNPANFTITYYNTLTGATNQDAADEIINVDTFSDSASSQVFANVSDNQGCGSSVATVNLQTTASQIDPAYVFLVNQCDDNTGGGVVNDGVATFNLTQAQNAIISQFPPADQPDLQVSFYETQAEALTQQNQIPLTGYQNTSSPFSQNLFVRVNNTNNNSCYGLGEHVTLSVSQQPEFEVESPQYICLNDLPKTLTVLNPQDDYTYVWYRNGNDQTGVVGIDRIAEVYSPGTYTVVATNADGSGCSTEMEIEVLPSSIATITNVITDMTSPNSTVTIEFEGYSDDYEYNIDFQPFENTHISQLSGSQGEVITYQAYIENPMGGYQTIRVRDRHGCGVAIEEVCVLGFPRFFTPNGDGVNDRWQIFGAEDDCFDNAIVNIFDRFGKLVKQFSSEDDGWNGTFNGRPLPATDYWFTVKFANENMDVYKGHFSLKR